MVDDHKPLDIKRKEFHTLPVSAWSINNIPLVRYHDYGNILYRAAFIAFGISEKDLFLGANRHQILKSGLEESKDNYSIKRGKNIYNHSIIRNQVSNTMRYV